MALEGTGLSRVYFVGDDAPDTPLQRDYCVLVSNDSPTIPLARI